MLWINWVWVALHFELATSDTPAKHQSQAYTFTQQDQPAINETLRTTTQFSAKIGRVNSCLFSSTLVEEASSSWCRTSFIHWPWSESMKYIFTSQQVWIKWWCGSMVLPGHTDVGPCATWTYWCGAMELPGYTDVDPWCYLDTLMWVHALPGHTDVEPLVISGYTDVDPHHCLDTLI